MPVLIWAGAADEDVYVPLAERLLEGGGEVRCYFEEDNHDLRQLGCKIAVGDLDDDVNLEAALTNVHTFVVLLPDPGWISSKELLDYLRRTGFAAAAGAKAAKVAQTIVILPGIVTSDSHMGRVYREVESAFSSVTPLCVIVTGLLWGAGRPLPKLVGTVGAPERRVSVLSIDDLSSIVVAADDRETMTGRWEAGGRTLSLGELGDFGSGTPAGNPLLAQALSRDLVLGNSAMDELDVETSDVAPVRST